MPFNLGNSLLTFSLPSLSGANRLGFEFVDTAVVIINVLFMLAFNGLLVTQEDECVTRADKRSRDFMYVKN